MANFNPMALCERCHCPVKVLPLTKRMVEILIMLLAEKTVKEIAFDLQCSIKNIETHRANIYQATGTDNPVGLVRWALEQGFTFAEMEHHPNREL